MKFARILSMPFLVVSFIGAASASANGPFSLGEGPYPPVGEEVWRFVAPRSTASSTTRAQVVAELREAQRLGQISIGEEPWRFVSPPAAPLNTRARVVAELREAQRLRLAVVGGLPVATPEQERLISLAGLRVLEEPAMAMR